MLGASPGVAAQRRRVWGASRTHRGRPQPPEATLAQPRGLGPVVEAENTEEAEPAPTGGHCSAGASSSSSSPGHAACAAPMPLSPSTREDAPALLWPRRVRVGASRTCQVKAGLAGHPILPLCCRHTPPAPPSSSAHHVRAHTRSKDHHCALHASPAALFSPVVGGEWAPICAYLAPWHVQLRSGLPECIWPQDFGYELCRAL